MPRAIVIGSAAPRDSTPLPKGRDDWAGGSDELARRRAVALVGHELRTPLAAALLYLDIADRRAGAGADTATVRAALTVARSEVQRLDQLVRRVMELERFGRAVMHPGRCNLGEVVRHAIQRALKVYRTAQLRFDIAEGDGLVGWWDATDVEQIVQNLISNALRFGKGHPVQVTLEITPSGVRLMVRDRGIGIGHADRERIFRRYVRSASGGGLGLGLWLVRELAHAHGGDVQLRSRPGRGSVFTVTLRPLRAGPVPRDTPTPSQPQDAPAAGLAGA